MKTLKNLVCGEWRQAASGFRPLFDPCTEEPIAQASTAGIDFAAVLDFARNEGGRALRAMTFAGRAGLLKRMSEALHERRDELIDLCLANLGATRKDAKFDLDGATGTLAYYAGLGEALGERKLLLDGEGTALGRSSRFWGQHVLVPRRGAALLVNAFNFPAWGLAEKAACALLAGVPVIAKPATSTALITARCIEIVAEADILPPGAVSLLAGSTGDLVGRLGSQDVLAFTGSASTALALRASPNLLAASARVNIEADSLNAAVLAPDPWPGSETLNLFYRDLYTEMTQKTGQKCTAVRRVVVPAGRMDEVAEEMGARLAAVVTGNPTDERVTMGPLATADQLADCLDGVARLGSEARLVFGSGERIDGAGNPAGKGWFLGPTLLAVGRDCAGDVVHEHEVFGPVATLVPYDGSPQEAARLVSRGGGSLVTSVYSDDDAWVAALIAEGASWSGRFYLGSEKMAGQALGSGTALPQSLHGGPGRAGGGQELGGLAGLHLYMQRVALQGSRHMIRHLCGE